MENAEKTMKNEHVKMVATANAITEEMIGHEDEDVHEDEDHHHGDMDPHVWISPILSDALAYSIKESLIEIAPDKKADFEKNYEELQDDLLKLDRQFIEMAVKRTFKNIFCVPCCIWIYCRYIRT